jgi:hypothetical protein
LYFFFGVLVGGFIVAIMCFSLSISTTRDCPMYYYTYYCDYPAGYHPLTSTGVQVAPSMDGLMEAPDHRPHVYNFDKEDNINPSDLPEWYDGKELSKVVLHEYKMLVVVDGRGQCDLLKTVVDTWGGSTGLLVIGDTSCLSSQVKKKMRLQNSKVYIYNDVVEANRIIHYIHHSMLIEDFYWYHFLSPDTYLNTWRLETLLKKHSYREHHLFGKIRNIGGSQTKYCSSNIGYIASQATIRDLIRKNVKCLSKLSTTSVDLLFDIGHCIVDGLSLKCSEHLSSSKGIDFLEDMKNISLSLDSWHHHNSEYKHISVIHPVNSVYTFHKLHEYYTLIEYNQTMDHLNLLKRTALLASERLKEMNEVHSPDPILLKQDEYPSFGTELLGLNEVKSWTTFDATSIYEEDSILPNKDMYHYRYYKQELDFVLLEVVRQANSDYPSLLLLHRVVNGYFKHDGLQGNLYVFDVELVELNNPNVFIRRTFSLLRPLVPHFVALPSKNVGNETIHFIIPINKVQKKFENFLMMYERIALSISQPTHLVIVVYNEDDYNHCRDLIDIYTNKYPGAKFTLLQDSGEFTRARAINKGTSVLNNSDLMFMCDVDMDISDLLLDNCRHNTVRHRQVYFPTVFKMYNMDFIYSSETKPQYPWISRKHGHWGYYGYGMVCIYKSDFVKVGGLGNGFRGWGGEDVEFYERVIQHKYSVFRAPAPWLAHKWHPKDCSTVSDEMKSSCMSSQSEVLADRKDLAKFIYKFENKLFT